MSKKIENTLENKAKFFAQYWGQEVFSKTHGATTYILDYVRLGSISDSSIIELKPLSQISDEDAIEVAKIEDDYTNSLLRGKALVDVIERDFVRFNVSKITQITDFLRSRGYAMPWMGLSVENLIEYGWIKLNED